MSKIILPVAFSNATALPTDIDLKQYLIENSAVTHWWQFDTEYATVDASNNLTALAAIKGGKTITFGNVPPVLSKNSAYGVDTDGVAYPVATLNSASNMAGTTSGNVSLPTVFSFVTFGRATSADVGMILRHGVTRLQTSLAAMQFFAKGGGINIGATVAHPQATPNITIGTATASTIKGKSGRSGATASAAVTGSTTTTIFEMFVNSGTNAGGDWSDILVFNVDLLDSANADLLEKVYQYFEQTYDVAL